MFIDRQLHLKLALCEGAERTVLILVNVDSAPSHGAGGYWLRGLLTSHSWRSEKT